jgi:hypothetical protein
MDTQPARRFYAMKNSNTEDRYSRLAAQVEYPESWQPEASETLVGELVRWETGTTRSGKSEEIAVIRETTAAELALLRRMEHDPDVQRLRQIAQESGFDHVSRPLAAELRRLLQGRSS